MKYKVGYVAGVFDLFHIGHLNLIRRAKEQCEYLMVGVLTDEEVFRWKQRFPYIPYDERSEIVEAIRYVDEVIKVDSHNIDRIDSWKLLHFDCQFSGDDYAKSKAWQRDREKLRELGADIVFLPYTQKTSSTKIKELIEKALI